MRKIMLCLFVIIVSALPIAAQADDVGHIRLAHFVADAQEVDVYLNGEVLVEGLGFPSVSDWLEVPTGENTLIVVSPAGTTPAEAEITIGPVDVNLSADDWISITAIGEVGHETLSLQPINENYTTIPEGMTRLSLFHAIPNMRPVNVSANDSQLVPLLAYPRYFDEEGDGFATFDLVANTYDLSIQSDEDTSVLNIDQLTMGQNRHYFVALVGTATDPQFILLTDDFAERFAEMEPTVDPTTLDLGDGSVHVRLAHFAPIGTPVDIYVNGELNDQQVAFPSMTEWREMDAGVYDIAIVAEGSTLDTALIRSNVPLATDAWITVAAIGTVDQDTLTLQLIEENFESSLPGETRISVFHAIPNGRPINFLANEAILLVGVGYPGFFEGGDGFATVDVVAGEFGLQIMLEDGRILDIGQVNMGRDRNYFIAALGLDENPLYILEITDMDQMR